MSVEQALRTWEASTNGSFPSLALGLTSTTAPGESTSSSKGIQVQFNGLKGISKEIQRFQRYFKGWIAHGVARFNGFKCISKDFETISIHLNAFQRL